MNEDKSVRILLYSTVAIIACMISILAFFGIIRHDSPMEQAVEQVIKNETGLEVDLSPEDGKK